MATNTPQNPDWPIRSNWQQTSDGKMWYCVDISTGAYWANVDYHQIGSEFFAFDEKGIMREGVWFNDRFYKSEPWYERGWMLKSQWFYSGGKWYYLLSDGRKAMGGEWRIDDKYYAFNDSGHMLSKTWVDGKYYGDGGARLNSQWLTIENKKYYLTKNGKKATGETKISGTYYLFGDDGVLKTNSWNSDKNRYYNSSGALIKSQWLTLDSKTYYLKSDGYKATGITTIGGFMRLFDDDGVLITSDTLKTIDNKTYIFSGGRLAKNTWKKIGSDWYYLGSDGVAYSGGDRAISGKHFWFTNDGRCLKDGLKTVEGEVWYYQEGKDALGHGTGRGVRQSKSLTNTKGVKPTDMTVTRDGTKLKAGWKIPSTIKGNFAWRGITAEWRITSVSGNTITKTVSLAANATSAEFDINGFYATTPSGKWYTRSSFWPGGEFKVSSITLKLTCKGKYVKDAEQSYTYVYEHPKPPTIELSFSNNTLTAKIKSERPSNIAKESRSTIFTVTLRKANGTTQVLASSWSTTENEQTYTRDMSAELSNMSDPGSYVYIDVAAFARGIRGDSVSASARRYFMKPPKAAITSVAVDKKATGGKITVRMTSGSYPVDIKSDVVLQLRRAFGTDKRPTGGWSNVSSASSTAKATALYDAWDNCDPADGDYTWYQIVATKDGVETYGDAFRADALFTAKPTAASTNIAVTSVEPNEDYTSARVEVGWKSELVEPKGTEVSWSTDPEAWFSTKQPEAFEFDWQDATPAVSGWDGTAAINVRGLEQGTTYYFSARRTYKDGDHSEYARRESLFPANQVTSNISLGAPAFVLRGDPIPVYWTFDGDVPQRRFDVHPVDNIGIAYASGETPITSATIPAEAYGDENSVTFYVAVAIESAFAQSAPITVEIVDRPSCDVWCPDVCGEQPFGFEVYTDNPKAQVVYRLVAEGIVYERPEGTVRQLAGDVIHSDTPDVNWTNVLWRDTALYAALEDAVDEAQAVVDAMDPSDPEYGNAQVALADAQAALAAKTGTVLRAQLALPESEIIDSGSYTIHAVAVDASTEVKSDTASSTFQVVWEHQAPAPYGGSVEVDSDGRTVTIRTVAAEDAEPTDIYDLYRGTKAGFDLVKSSFEMGSTVTDRWPAFGGQSYRLVCRTKDGDFEWVDYPYVLDVDAVRFDWADGSSESYHNLQFSDAYTKGFERREHMGGRGAGYWNGSYERTGSYNVTAIKGMEAPNLEALGRHAGAVFCRTPDGFAFECNVDVNREDRHHSMLEDYAMTVTEVELTDAFRPTDTDVA